jgi:hypothetical protein
LAVKRRKKNRDHLFKPGKDNPRAKGLGGRPKGVPNKITRDIKLALIQALHRLGGEDYFVKLATKDRRSFSSLLGRVIPHQIEQANPEETADKIRANLAAMQQSTVPTKEK